MEPSQWRWWDGWAWTVHASVRAKKPALPGWSSVPVIVASVLRRRLTAEQLEQARFGTGR